MKIEIPDDIALKTGFDETEMLEFLAVSLYKQIKINGVEGGEILGSSEMGFRRMLEKYDEYVNYGVEDYLEDIETLRDI